MAEELLLQIEEGLHESKTGLYAISIIDIILYIPFAQRKGLLGLESLFCILSSVNWHHDISTGISYDAEDLSLYLFFRSSKDEEPSIESCREMDEYI